MDADQSPEPQPLMTAQTMRELANEVVGPDVKITPEVQLVLQEAASFFVKDAVRNAVKLAGHRGSDTLEPKDFLFHFRQNWDMEVPGFSDSHSLEPRLHAAGSIRDKEQQVRKAKNAAQQQEERQLQRKRKLDDATKAVPSEARP